MSIGSICMQFYLNSIDFGVYVCACAVTNCIDYEQRLNKKASMWMRREHFNVLLTMHNNFFIILLLLCASVNFVFSQNIETNHSDCPEKCVCRKVNDNGSQLKVKCGGLPQVKLTSIKEINFDIIRYDVVQLYVFKNCFRFFFFKIFILFQYNN